LKIEFFSTRLETMVIDALRP